MRYGMFMPNFGPFADAGLVRDLAAEAEACGWDGFFLWDHMLYTTQPPHPVADPWIELAAAACATTTIQLGPLLTPLARRRPWKVARETVTLDHLSHGRLIFGAGLGAPIDADFGRFGEELSDRGRAIKLDEALEVLELLWSGREVSFRGEEYQIGPVTFLPTPVQRPRIPVWIGGKWPNRAPFRRAARWDGLVPELAGGGLPTVADIADMTAFVREHRASHGVGAARPFDVAVNGPDCWSREAELVKYADAGVTWWLERISPRRAFDVTEAAELIRRGPPA